MRYVSSRGGVPPASFEEALLAGYCADGGLYVPETLPTMTAEWLADLAQKDFCEVATSTLRLWISEDEIPTAELRAIVAAAFGTFHHPDVAPIVPLPALAGDEGSRVLIAELFHGQTLAFKDFGQGLVCSLLEFFARRRSLRVHVLVSTTGDTGPAAIEAVRAHCKQVSVTAMYPIGRISELQRRQMTTVRAPNVNILPFEGEGDDLDVPIKALSLDAAFQKRHGLCAINSINVGRVVSQTAHHVWAYLRALADCAGGAANSDSADGRAAEGSAQRAPPRVVVIVPTGAMGNSAAGLWCMAAGLPLHRLLLATNDNDVVVRAVRDELLERKPMAHTVSEVRCHGCCSSGSSGVLRWPRVPVWVQHLSCARLLLHLTVPTAPLTFLVPSNCRALAPWPPCPRSLPRSNPASEPAVTQAMNSELPYNFERALHLAAGRDSTRVRGWMAAVDAGKPLRLEQDALEWLRARLVVGSASNEGTLARISQTWADHRYAVDPHTAVGLHVAAALRADASDPLGCGAESDRVGPLVAVCLATAHPCKFQEAVTAALGERWWSEEMMAADSEQSEQVSAARMPARARRLASLVEETCPPLRVGEDWVARLRGVIEATASANRD